MNPIVILIMSLMLGFGVFTLILISIIRLVWHFIDVKYFVDVHTFKVGEQFLKIETMNCRIAKKKDDSGFENFVLLKGKREFPFHKKTAFSRQKDGKTVVMYQEIEGKLFPFLPTHEIVSKPEAKYLTLKTGLDWKIFTEERNDELVEDALRETWKKISDAGKKSPRKMSGLGFLFMIVAGLLILGMIIWLVLKGANFKLPGMP